MRMLAEFIMRSPVHAIALAALGVVIGIPLLSQVVIGLVTLRNGWQSGLLVLATAIVPLALLASFDDNGLIAAFFVSGMLVVTYVVAWVLRTTISWSFALVTAAVCSAGVAALVVYAQPEVLQDLSELFANLAENLQQQDAEVVPFVFDSEGVSHVLAIGLIALALCWFSVLGLFLGRWFQALLYNPGGFQAEFHQIRLDRTLAIACVALAFVFQFSGQQFIFLANLAVFPLEIAGLSLVHSVAKRLGSGTVLLVVLYLSLVVLTPFVLFVLMVLGFTDVWFDYRKKMNRTNS